MVSLTSDTPKVSIVMPLYNADIYLGESIESILNQTFRDFELIIIYDNPSDEILEILLAYQQNDSRIRLFTQKRQGLIASLNQGCSFSKGEYILRMDADDFCVQDRIEKQVTFMENHPEVGICGSFIHCVDKNNKIVYDLKFPLHDKEIKFHMLFGNCIAHPSVIMRQKIIKELNFYTNNYLHAEDYDLWSRASSITQLANLPDFLVSYRIHGENVSILNFEDKDKNSIKLRYALINDLFGYKLPEEPIINLMSYHREFNAITPDQISAIAKLIYAIYQRYISIHVLTPSEFQEVTNITGFQLLSLSISSIKIYPWMSLKIFIKALKLNILTTFYLSKVMISMLCRKPHTLVE